MHPSELWRFLPIGYLLTIAVETPILVVGLSPRHSIRRRLFAGIWLTACTYPIVILVLSQFFAERSTYLAVAELFAPLAECALFWFAFRSPNSGPTSRDFGVIVIANLASFGAGELFNAWHWFGLFGRY